MGIIDKNVRKGKCGRKCSYVTAVTVVDGDVDSGHVNSLELT